jgi:hypothetical protein
MEAPGHPRVEQPHHTGGRKSVMSEQLVRVLKSAKGTDFVEVPLSEVPPGYILVRKEGLGDCYLDPKTLNSRKEPFHPEFPETVRDSIRRTMKVLAKMQPMTFEEWEHGFRCDLHAWREIAIYERISEAFERFTSHLGNNEWCDEQRKQIFGVIMHFTNNGQTPTGYKTVAVGNITAKRVQEIGDWMFSESVVKRMEQSSNQLRDLIQPDRLAGPDRVQINALFDEDFGPNKTARFDPRELVASADVILGVNIDDEHEFLVFGADYRNEFDLGCLPSGLRILRVELDQDTDDLEKLIALVTVAKGKHDYQSDTP